MLSSTAAYVVYAAAIGGVAGLALYAAGSFLGALPAGTGSAVICVVMGGSILTAALLAHRERVKVNVREWMKARGHTRHG